MPCPTRSTQVAAVALLVAWLAPAVASADVPPRLSVDWDRLSAALQESASWFAPRQPAPYGLKDAAGHTQAPPWIGTSPRLALVARDWGVSQVLWGHLAVTDQLRLSRSSRMVVARLRLADGRLSPFAHVGLGQWRVDTSVVPALPTDVELAGQLGGGFELEVTRQVALALEADCTMLYREGRSEGAGVSTGPLWSSLLAARARF